MTNKNKNLEVPKVESHSTEAISNPFESPLYLTSDEKPKETADLDEKNWESINQDIKNLEKDIELRSTRVANFINSIDAEVSTFPPLDPKANVDNLFSKINQIISNPDYQNSTKGILALKEILFNLQELEIRTRKKIDELDSEAKNIGQEAENMIVLPKKGRRKFKKNSIIDYINPFFQTKQRDKHEALINEMREKEDRISSQKYKINKIIEKSQVIKHKIILGKNTVIKEYFKDTCTKSQQIYQKITLQLLANKNENLIADDIINNYLIPLYIQEGVINSREEIDSQFREYLEKIKELMKYNREEINQPFDENKLLKIQKEIRDFGKDYKSKNPFYIDLDVINRSVDYYNNKNSEKIKSRADVVGLYYVNSNLDQSADLLSQKIIHNKTTNNLEDALEETKKINQELFDTKPDNNEISWNKTNAYLILGGRKYDHASEYWKPIKNILAKKTQINNQLFDDIEKDLFFNFNVQENGYFQLRKLRDPKVIEKLIQEAKKYKGKKEEFVGTINESIEFLVRYTDPEELNQYISTAPAVIQNLPNIILNEKSFFNQFKKDFPSQNWDFTKIVAKEEICQILEEKNTPLDKMKEFFYDKLDQNQLMDYLLDYRHKYKGKCRDKINLFLPDLVDQIKLTDLNSIKNIEFIADIVDIEQKELYEKYINNQLKAQTLNGVPDPQTFLELAKLLDREPGEIFEDYKHKILSLISSNNFEKNASVYELIKSVLKIENREIYEIVKEKFDQVSINNPVEFINYLKNFGLNYFQIDSPEILQNHKDNILKSLQYASWDTKTKAILLLAQETNQSPEQIYRESLEYISQQGIETSSFGEIEKLCQIISENSQKDIGHYLKNHINQSFAGLSSVNGKEYAKFFDELVVKMENTTTPGEIVLAIKNYNLQWNQENTFTTELVSNDKYFSSILEQFSRKKLHYDQSKLDKIASFNRLIIENSDLANITEFKQNIIASLDLIASNQKYNYIFDNIVEHCSSVEDLINYQDIFSLIVFNKSISNIIDDIDQDQKNISPAELLEITREKTFDYINKNRGNNITFISNAYRHHWQALFGSKQIEKFLKVLPVSDNPLVSPERRNAFNHNDYDRTSKFFLNSFQYLNNLDVSQDEYQTFYQDFKLDKENFDIITNFVEEFGLSNTPIVLNYYRNIVNLEKNNNKLPVAQIEDKIFSISDLHKGIEKFRQKILQEDAYTEIENLTSLEIELLRNATNHSSHTSTVINIDRILTDFKTAQKENLISPIPDYMVKMSIPINLVSSKIDLSNHTEFQEIKQEITEGIRFSEKPEKLLLDFQKSIVKELKQITKNIEQLDIRSLNNQLATLQNQLSEIEKFNLDILSQTNKLTDKDFESRKKLNKQISEINIQTFDTIDISKISNIHRTIDEIGRQLTKEKLEDERFNQQKNLIFQISKNLSAIIPFTILSDKKRKLISLIQQSDAITNNDDLLKLILEKNPKEFSGSDEIVRKIIYCKTFETMLDRNVYQLTLNSNSAETVGNISNLIDVEIKEHILNIDIAKYWSDQMVNVIKKNKKNLQQKFKNPIKSIKKIRESLAQSSQSIGQKEVSLMPDNGLVGEMTGYIAKVCYTKVQPLLTYHPKLTPYKFIAHNPETNEKEFIGSVLLFGLESTDKQVVFAERDKNKPSQIDIDKIMENKEKVLLVRAINIPNEAKYDIENWLENFFDQLSIIAKKGNFQKIVVPSDSGAISNYGKTVNHIKNKYIKNKVKHFLTEKFDFNDHNITNDIYVVRDIKSENKH